MAAYARQVQVAEATRNVAALSRLISIRGAHAEALFGGGHVDPVCADGASPRKRRGMDGNSLTACLPLATATAAGSMHDGQCPGAAGQCACRACRRVHAMVQGRRCDRRMRGARKALSYAEELSIQPHRHVPRAHRGGVRLASARSFGARLCFLWKLG